MKLWVRIALFVAGIATSFLALAPSARAASINVGGACSLDNAIASVNGAADTGGCIATDLPYGTNDTIALPAGTITLANNIIPLNSSMTIVGAGMGQTIIDGVSTYSGLVCLAPGVPTVISVALRGFTMTRMTQLAFASAQACNLNASEIEVTQSIANPLGLIVLIDDAGGPYSNLSVNSSLTDIYIHNNMETPNDGLDDFLVVAYSTGPSNNTNTVTINRVTFAENPNLIAIGANAFGYVNNTVNLLITNTTIDGSSQSGIGLVAGTTGQYGGIATTNVQVRNTTIVNFDSPSGLTPALGLGVFASAQAGSTSNVTLDMENTLLAGNTFNGSPLNCAVQNQGQGGAETSTLNSLGYNIADDASCGTAQATDMYSVPTNNILTTLGPLQNNGGLVPTRALLAGSPAIDTGNTISSVTTDARGITRPQGAAYDVGAFELVQVPAQTPSMGSAHTLADTGLNWYAVAVLVGILFLMGYSSLSFWIGSRNF